MLFGAGIGIEEVTVDIDRDPSRTEAYSAAYTIPTPITNPTGISATFYAQANQQGDIVGTATAQAHMEGKLLEFDTIQLTGTIDEVVISDQVVMMGSGSTQLTFVAKSSEGDSVAVSPGSARWTLINGASLAYLGANGMFTPIHLGTTRVLATVDGVASAAASVDIVDAPVPVYSWNDGKGGYMGNPGSSAVEGNFFEVSGGRDIVVTKLGYEADRPTNPGGITAIFNENGAILAQANITAEGELVNGYYYESIPPLRLSAGSKYFVGSLHGTGASGSCRSETNLAVHQWFITDLGTWYKFSSTIDGGTWAQSGTRHYVGNFQAYQLP